MTEHAKPLDMREKPSAPPRSDTPRPKKRDVDGWFVLDKPTGVTSTHAVSIIKRLFRAKKAGHAGTLDPLASGCLPIALGEATKTVPYVMDGRKAYRFTVTWGAETDTDDSEGRVIATSDQRPTRAEVETALPAFVGVISQTPPKFSAIRVAGERAYDLAREGEDVELKPREILIEELVVVAHDDATTTLDARTGKGAYVRAIARDLGRALGCGGHISALRRTRVGPFRESDLTPLPPRDSSDEALSDAQLAALLKPASAALSELPSVTVSRGDAGRLLRGQGVILRGRDAPITTDAVAVHADGALIAIGEIDGGELRPRRVFLQDRR
ncbi:tRNA pseudouridine(55) synthase TruB [Terrarubrum flagellatum]|uniref:tRNA pseudouridine(55) synthase TruB n=1 Tax=Terrirubrum flagellatum TaxID=2895980 RepID=UPI00314544F5